MREMEKMNFTDLKDLAEFMYDIADVESEDVTVVTFYETAAELLHCLCEYNDLKLYSIDCEDPEFGGYNKEYYISILDKNVFVEKVYKNDDGIAAYNESNVILFDGNASSSIVKRNTGTMYEYEIGEDFDNENKDVDSDKNAEYNISFSCDDPDCQYCKKEPDYTTSSASYVPAESCMSYCNCDTIEFALKVIELLIGNR